MLFLRPPGVGKSCLVQALGYQAIKAGFAVLYRSIFDVVRDFLHDEPAEGQDRTLTRYLKPDLLIIDDMGMKQLPQLAVTTHMYRRPGCCTATTPSLAKRSS